MLTNHEPDRNIDELTDTEIYDAIRYLESEAGPSNKDQYEDPNDDGWALGISVMFIVLIIVLAFTFL